MLMQPPPYRRFVARGIFAIYTHLARPGIKRGPYGRRLLQSWAWRRRSAFTITETELNVIAALAMIGLSSNPKNG